MERPPSKEDGALRKKKRPIGIEPDNAFDTGGISEANEQQGSSTSAFTSVPGAFEGAPLIAGLPATAKTSVPGVLTDDVGDPTKLKARIKAVFGSRAPQAVKKTKRSFVPLDAAQRQVETFRRAFDTSDERRRFIEDVPVGDYVRQKRPDIVDPLAKIAGANFMTRFADLERRTGFFTRNNNAELITELRGAFQVARAMNIRSFPVQDEQSVNAVDTRINDPMTGELLVTIEQILKDAELGPQFMQALDKATSGESDEIRRDLQRAREAGTPYQADVVIAGGGLTTAIAAPIFQLAGRDVFLVTQSDRLGGPARGRFYPANNTDKTVDVNEPNLPLAKGSTFPIRPQGIQSTAFSSQQATREENATIIQCLGGRVARYPAWWQAANGIAATIYGNTDRVLTGAEVIPASVRRADGNDKVLFSVKDVRGAAGYPVEANNLLFLTGPGVATTNVKDDDTARLYAQEQARIGSDIRRIRDRANNLKDQQIELEKTRQADPPALAASKEENLREKLSALKLYDGPAVWSLQTMEDAWDLWANDLDKKEEQWPFTRLFSQDARVAFIGSGDSKNVAALFLNGAIPGVYPEGFDPAANTPRQVVYGSVATTPEEFRLVERPLYHGAFPEKNEDRVSGIPYPVTSYKEVVGPNGQIIGYEVSAIDDDGFITSDQFTDIIDVSGVRPLGLSRVINEANDRRFLDNPRTSINVAELRNSQGAVISKGNPARTVVIAGTAAEIPPERADIIDLIEGLGIGENSLSAWANGPGVEKAVYDVARRGAFDTEKVERILEGIPPPREATQISPQPVSSPIVRDGEITVDAMPLSGILFADVLNNTNEALGK